MLTEKITSLKLELIEYANFVERMIEMSIKGLIDRKRDILIEVIEKDEPRANNLEIKLDELCTSIIAQYEPKARDLRTILMVLQMNKDLERIADHVVNIAESSLFLLDKPSVKPLIDIPQMAEIVMKMVSDSINSFINETPMVARDICSRDSKVDDLRDQVLRELITFMISDPTTIERAIHLLRVSNNLERIGDLTTNICEDIIYAVEGKVIKHHLEESHK